MNLGKVSAMFKLVPVNLKRFRKLAYHDKLP